MASLTLRKSSSVFAPPQTILKSQTKAKTPQFGTGSTAKKRDIVCGFHNAITDVGKLSAVGIGWGDVVGDRGVRFGEAEWLRGVQEGEEEEGNGGGGVKAAQT